VKKINNQLPIYVISQNADVGVLELLGYTIMHNMQARTFSPAETLHELTDIIDDLCRTIIAGTDRPIRHKCKGQ
jgi:beta-xylosidase